MNNDATSVKTFHQRRFWSLSDGKSFRENIDMFNLIKAKESENKTASLAAPRGRAAPYIKLDQSGFNKLCRAARKFLIAENKKLHC